MQINGHVPVPRHPRPPRSPNMPTRPVPSSRRPTLLRCWNLAVAAIICVRYVPWASLLILAPAYLFIGACFLRLFTGNPDLPLVATGLLLLHVRPWWRKFLSERWGDRLAKTFLWLPTAVSIVREVWKVFCKLPLTALDQFFCAYGMFGVGLAVWCEWVRLPVPRVVGYWVNEKPTVPLAVITWGRAVWKGNRRALALLAIVLLFANLPDCVSTGSKGRPGFDDVSSWGFPAFLHDFWLPSFDFEIRSFGLPGVAADPFNRYIGGAMYETTGVEFPSKHRETCPPATCTHVWTDWCFKECGLHYIECRRVSGWRALLLCFFFFFPSLVLHGLASFLPLSLSFSFFTTPHRHFHRINDH